MVVVGLTEVALEVATAPTPLSILAEVALVEVNVSTEDCPDTIVVGDAEREHVGGAVPVVVNVASDEVALAPELFAEETA